MEQELQVCRAVGNKEEGGLTASTGVLDVGPVEISLQIKWGGPDTQYILHSAGYHYSH